MKISQTDANIVVIGGGTGSFAVLSALKNHVQNITALVNMADDGGSTGVLRDEMGVLPPGDVRQCLVALSRSSAAMRDLFQYRFPKESFAAGHSLGNLFLTAAEKQTGNFAEGVMLASQVLNIVGRVIPVTLDNVRLAMYEDGKGMIKSEHVIDEYVFAEQRPRLHLEPAAVINPAAREAILGADMIVIAPGDVYTSLAPAFLVHGVSEALQKTKARVAYVCNLVTKPGQTDGFKVHDFAAEIERFIGHPRLDYVIYNTVQPAKALLEKYAREREFGVQIDAAALKKSHYTAIGASLVKDMAYQQQSNDTLLQRSWIRHDGDKVARLLLQLIAQPAVSTNQAVYSTL